MAEEKRRLVERILDASYLTDLGQRSVEDIKTMRDECRATENELSFERRLCQARVEILRAELERREHGGDEDELLSRLPQILATELGRTDVALPTRARDFSVPRSADVPRRRVDEIVGEQTIARLPKMSMDEVKSVTSSLEQYEKTVSSRRRQVQQVLDAVQEEIVRRFKSGEADPTAALG
ncbi:MAG TPA: hypothetical protein VM784_01430 [Actinomycetota bacterium]|nr:hypothetical protein [Actinomycetota bacterium]